MAGLHGAALISAAVRAACQAKAPRRTVASVAAAVTTALLQLATAKGTQAQGTGRALAPQQLPLVVTART